MSLKSSGDGVVYQLEGPEGSIGSFSLKTARKNSPRKQRAKTAGEIGGYLR